MKKLLETGVENLPSPSYCAEYMKLSGYGNGGDRKSSGQDVQLKTGDQLAEELHVSQRQMNRTIQVADVAGWEQHG